MDYNPTYTHKQRQTLLHTCQLPFLLSSLEGSADSFILKMFRFFLHLLPPHPFPQSITLTGCPKVLQLYESPRCSVPAACSGTCPFLRKPLRQATAKWEAKGQPGGTTHRNAAAPLLKTFFKAYINLLMSSADGKAIINTNEATLALQTSCVCILKRRLMDICFFMSVQHVQTRNVQDLWLNHSPQQSQLIPQVQMF